MLKLMNGQVNFYYFLSKIILIILKIHVIPLK